jgi:protein-disulfide isomerase
VRRRALRVLLAAAAFAAPSSARAQETPGDDLRRELQALREMVRQMQLDLDEIRAGLPRRTLPTPVGAVVDVRPYPYRGERLAPLTLVELSDFQCPFCARHARETQPSIEAEYVRTGKLKVVFVDLPLERQHPRALRAAEAAACAGEQRRRWEMHERLFARPDRLEPWSAHAEALGLDAALLEECLASGRHEAAIRRGMAEAGRLGVTTTPYFLVGRTERDGSRVRVAATIDGAKPFAAFREAVEALGSEAAGPAEARPTP